VASAPATPQAQAATQATQASNESARVVISQRQLPPAPISIPIVGADGRVTDAWVGWLNHLRARLGNVSSYTQDDLAALDAFGTAAPGPQELLQSIIQGFQAEPLGRVQRPLDPEVDPWGPVPGARIQGVQEDPWLGLPMVHPRYQETVWTPTIIGSTTPGTQTYTTQVGTLTRIGRMVIAAGRVTLSGLSGPAGNVLIGGLPFPGASTGFRTPVTVLNVSNLTGYTVATLGNSFVGASTTISLADSSAGSPVPVSALTATTSIDFQLIYQI
jgi:hypothetical protein